MLFFWGEWENLRSKTGTSNARVDSQKNRFLQIHLPLENSAKILKLNLTF